MNLSRHSDEQAVLDNSGDVVDLAGQGLGLFKRAEQAVQDVIPAIGYEIAALRLAAEVLETPGRGLPTERNYLDRQQTATQPGNQLGLIDHNQKSVAGLGHDLLPQECAPASFDQIERARVHFVGSIDRNVGGHIDSQGNFELASPRGDPLGSGNAGDAQAFADSRRQRVEYMLGRRACAQTDEHILNHLGDRGFSGYTFECSQLVSHSSIIHFDRARRSGARASHYLVVRPRRCALRFVRFGVWPMTPSGW